MKVHIVDDDPVARMVAAACLDLPDVSFQEFADSAQMHAALAEETPDLILLDIDMPGEDGLAACRKVRADGNESSQVMFVSVRNDLDTRLAAYDAGGNDFIVKPYEPEELARKVAVARQAVANRRGLAAQTDEARQTAFTAMTAMGEMGVVLDFMRAFFACETAEALAAKLLEGIGQFGLHGLAELRGREGRVCRSSQGTCTALEASILEHTSGMDRIFQFRDRIAINFPSVTVVIQSLPLDDPERTGRLRDLFAIFVEAADARLQALETARRHHTHMSGLADVIAELSHSLAGIDKVQTMQRLRSAETLQAFSNDANAAFVRLGLSDDQEVALSRMVERTQGQLAAIADEASTVGDSLRIIARRLQALAAQ